jgi:hypothetical protein
MMIENCVPRSVATALSTTSIFSRQPSPLPGYVITSLLREASDATRVIHERKGDRVSLIVGCSPFSPSSVSIPLQAGRSPLDDSISHGRSLVAGSMHLTTISVVPFGPEFVPLSASTFGASSTGVSKPSIRYTCVHISQIKRSAPRKAWSSS